MAKWSFDEAASPATHDSVSGNEDKVEGFYKYVPGVTGTGLRFDGYTTHVIRTARRLHNLQMLFPWKLGWH